jgi:uncharacterized membrane protein
MLGLRASAFNSKTAASEIGERQERAILMIAWLTRKGEGGSQPLAGDGGFLTRFLMIV